MQFDRIYFLSRDTIKATSFVWQLTKKDILALLDLCRNVLPVYVCVCLCECVAVHCGGSVMQLLSCASCFPVYTACGHDCSTDCQNAKVFANIFLCLVLENLKTEQMLKYVPK